MKVKCPECEGKKFVQWEESGLGVSDIIVYIDDCYRCQSTGKVNKVIYDLRKKKR